jgi:hypothetical protein
MIEGVEIRLADGPREAKSGTLVRKAILRTGKWPVTPLRGGLVHKPLTITRDGRSSKADNTVSLAELVTNFKLIGRNVPVPLSDGPDDHENLTRHNTGFVRDVWVEDADNGDAVLMATLDITEPDVREKVLRGTYADVSCGIPWSVVAHGQRFGTCLDHVAITNRPFVSGLGEFALAASIPARADSAPAETGTATGADRPLADRVRRAMQGR